MDRDLRLGGHFALTTSADHQLTPVEDLLAQHATTPERAVREALDGLDLKNLLGRRELAPQVRETLVTWRGHLSRRRHSFDAGAVTRKTR